MNYAVAGLVLAAGGAVVAALAMRRVSFYAGAVYHMTARSHRSFAVASLVAAAGFTAALRWNALAVPLLALYVLALILYAASFARGFSGEDE